ncbi:hypothetical protein [Bowmanella denitrificans]|uniref:hypothetical protein n=1 Tax=Bowmanella denitrificans TaxID=366582 RepID=UPI000C9B78F9|nr:hypothetical protein [Bowmanella denitrificans]
MNHTGLWPRQWAAKIRDNTATLQDVPTHLQALVREHLTTAEDHEFKNKKWASHKRKWPRK